MNVKPVIDRATAEGLLDRIVQDRRELHRRAEVGLELPKTVAYIKERLEAMRLRPTIAAGGLWADIGSDGDAPLVAIRADIDALPITEGRATEWTSEDPGAMHACGHDAHAACLLACAEFLAGNPPEGFRVRCLFQPGEEGCAGAVGMIEAGCLEGVSAIVGTHVGSIAWELGPGQAGLLPGKMMASSDRFRGAFLGRGGHGANPHLCADPIPAFAEFVMDLQRVRSRECDQAEPAVISICSVSAGSAFNVIPERLEFSGTARALDTAGREFLAGKIRSSAERIAELNGMRAEFEWLAGYPPLENHKGVSRAFLETSRALLGSDRVVELTKPSMGGEDFTYYLMRVPGCFWFLDTSCPEKGITHPNHHPLFDVDEALLWIAPFVNLNLAARLAAEAVASAPKSVR